MTNPLHSSDMPSSELLQKIHAMSPWHHKIELAGGAYTGIGTSEDATGSKVHQIEPSQSFAELTKYALPDGMQGRSFLDCGCNAGGYCFAARDAGAARTFGFDVRQHWIDQANFVMKHRSGPTDGMSFEVSDLLNLASMKEDFDVTWFSGLFYHLPDPVAGLKIAADRTKELIFVNTAVKATLPNEVETPSLIMKLEGTEQLMSGVHQLSWLPAGYQTMKKTMHWLGFPDVKLLFWKRVTKAGKGSGRLALVAAREPGRLAGVRDTMIED